VLEAVKDEPLIRVRVELPEAAKTRRPKKCASAAKRADGVDEQLVYVSSTIGREAFVALGLPLLGLPPPSPKLRKPT
jgi:hypothetical protein